VAVVVVAVVVVVAGILQERTEEQFQSAVHIYPHIQTHH
jgi:hypothetical protein